MGIAAQVDVAALFVQQILCGKLLRLEVFAIWNLLSVILPGNAIIKMFQLHGLRLGEVLSVRRNIHPIKPCLFGRLGVVKKQQIGGD